MNSITAISVSAAAEEPPLFVDSRPLAETQSLAHEVLELKRELNAVILAHNAKTFSNAVSQHLSVPNGTDPPEHTAYRRVIER